MLLAVTKLHRTTQAELSREVGAGKWQLGRIYVLWQIGNTVPPTVANENIRSTEQNKYLTLKTQIYVQASTIEYNHLKMYLVLRSTVLFCTKCCKGRCQNHSEGGGVVQKMGEVNHFYEKWGSVVNI